VQCGDLGRCRCGQAQDQILIRSSDLTTYEPAPGSTLRMLVGEDHAVGMTLIVASYPPGSVTSSHRHTAGSAIVVYEGRGVFTVGEDEVAAEAGDIVVVPAHAWHSFRNDGDGWLRLVGADEGAVFDARACRCRSGVAGAAGLMLVPRLCCNRAALAVTSICVLLDRQVRPGDQRLREPT
jgi:quercetin dioxygenase-like cupin family protein